MSSLMNLNYTEFKETLDKTPASQNILICGDHGIGKSQIIENYYKEKGFEVVTLFLGQMSDAGDLLGLPKEKKLTTGQIETLVMDFLPPAWWQTEKPFYLFLDEINRGRPEIAQVIFDLALNKKLGGRTLPEGSMIGGAANVGDEYQVTDLDPALVSRFNVYRLKPTVDEWLTYATIKKVDPRITTFIEKNHDQLDPKFAEDADAMDKTPDRRAWFKVDEMLKHSMPDRLETIDIKIIAGVIGQSAAGLFNKHCKSMATIDAKKVLMAKKFGMVEAEMRLLTMSEFFHLNKQLLNYVVANAEDIEADTKVHDLVCANFVKYVNVLVDLKFNEPVAELVNKLENNAEAGEILMASEEVYDTVQEFVDSIDVKL